MIVLFFVGDPGNYGVCDGAGEVALVPAEPLDDRGPKRLHKKSESVTLMRPPSTTVDHH
jgi:hypothetical protein